jgi:deoxyribodipyrimidine photo-lyase
MLAYDDSDFRHWRFVYESLQEMNEKLKALNAEIYIFHSEVLPILEVISSNYSIINLFSHEEIGNKISFDRDVEVQSFCMNNSINWKESQTNGVVRKLRSRFGWEKRWKSTMLSQPKIIDETNVILLHEKKQGQSSAGIVKNVDLRSDIDENIGNMVSDLKSKIFSTVLKQ